MEIFGDIERVLSEDLYPYRWPLTIALILVIAAAVWLSWRRGWVASGRRFASRRPVLSGGAALVAALLIVPVAWMLLSPLWQRTTLVEESPLAVVQMTETAETTTEVASGTAGTATAIADGSARGGFEARPIAEGAWMGADDFHFAEGRALIIEDSSGHYVLRVEDFSVRNGPDLFVYLSPDAAGYAAGAVNLGELKATDGAFNYELPDGLDPAGFASAVVWCREFSVQFGHATLVASDQP